MRGKGSDQGGRWSVGIWFALVGMSAGTVASFSMIGWTFTRGLYDGESRAEPPEYESETLIIEAEETPEGEPVAVGDELEGLIEPGSEPDTAASPAEPRAERVAGPAEEDAEAHSEKPAEERHEVEETDPPHLVPVDEDPDEGTGEGDCPGDESGWPIGGYGEDHGLHLDPDLLPLLEDVEVDLHLRLDLLN